MILGYVYCIQALKLALKNVHFDIELKSHGYDINAMIKACINIRSGQKSKLCTCLSVDHQNIWSKSVVTSAGR